MRGILKEAQPIEFWFEFGSNYSYLSVMRIEQAVARDKIRIEWKPFLLGPIFRDLGWEGSPFVLQKEKGSYVWRDMARRAEKYGLEFNKPSRFPRSAVLPMRVAILGAREPWIAMFAKNIMLQNWVHDMEIDDVGSVRQALQGLVPDPDECIAAALQDSNKLRLRRQTEEARRRHIFGAPTFFVGEEMFWGDDRLEDAIEAARRNGIGDAAPGHKIVQHAGREPL